MSDMRNSQTSSGNQTVNNGNIPEMREGFDSVKTRVDVAHMEIGKKIDYGNKVLYDKMERNSISDTRMKQEIMNAVNMSTEQILSQLTAGGKRGDADLTKLTPSQHYRNIKYSVISLMLTIFSAMLLLMTFMDFLQMAVVGTLHAVLMVNFIFIYLVAAGGIAMSLYQKKCFYPAGKLKDFIKSKNPSHNVSKTSFFIGIIVAGISTVLLLAVLIAVLV